LAHVKENTSKIGQGLFPENSSNEYVVVKSDLLKDMINNQKEILSMLGKMTNSQKIE